MWLQETIDNVSVALLLLSADYFADLATLKEFQAIVAHAKDGIRLIPILARPYDWQSIPELKSLVPLPRSGRALASLSFAEREEAAVEIARALALLVAQLRRGAGPPGQHAAPAHPSPNEPARAGDNESPLPSPQQRGSRRTRWGLSGVFVAAGLMGLFGLLVAAGLIYISWGTVISLRAPAAIDLGCTECDQQPDIPRASALPSGPPPVPPAGLAKPSTAKPARVKDESSHKPTDPRTGHGGRGPDQGGAPSPRSCGPGFVYYADLASRGLAACIQRPREADASGCSCEVGMKGKRCLLSGFSDVVGSTRLEGREEQVRQEYRERGIDLCDAMLKGCRPTKDDGDRYICYCCPER